MVSSGNGNTGSVVVGLIGLLAILFIALKLLDIIRWSWLWVLSPIWICASFLMHIFTTMVIVMYLKEREK